MPNSSPNTTSGQKKTDFYHLAEAAGVPVVHTALPEVRSVALAVGGSGVVGLDSSRPTTRAEEQAHLGHELGHCLYGGFYTRSSPYDLIERHEFRADRWYIRHAIPRKTLFRLLREGREVWEIAEMLDTTEEYVWQAYCYYRENR